MPDEIMEEVWPNRDNFAKACNYDLALMVDRLRELERQPGRVVVSLENLAKVAKAGTEEADSK